MKRAKQRRCEFVLSFRVSKNPRLVDNPASGWSCRELPGICRINAKALNKARL